MNVKVFFYNFILRCHFIYWVSFICRLHSMGLDRNDPNWHYFICSCCIPIGQAHIADLWTITTQIYWYITFKLNLYTLPSASIFDWSKFDYFYRNWSSFKFHDFQWIAQGWILPKAERHHFCLKVKYVAQNTINICVFYKYHSCHYFEMNMTSRYIYFILSDFRVR